MAAEPPPDGDAQGHSGCHFGGTHSYWMMSSDRVDYPSVTKSLHVDVAVVGAGITGVTTALLLKRDGFKVALVEARRAGEQITGYTTAKITSLHELIYADLLDSAGGEIARLYGESQQAAIEQIAELVKALDIDCGFERTYAYTYCEDEVNLRKVRREARVAADLGLPASFTTESCLPFGFAGAVRFAYQAQFHPLKYLQALLRNIAGDDCYVFENSRVLTVESGEPCRLRIDGGELTAAQVVIATGLPILDRAGAFSMAHPRAHVALAASIDESSAFEGMYINAEQPKRSVRLYRQNCDPVLIATGNRFKLDESDPAGELRALEHWVRRRFGVKKILSSWWNEDFHAIDRRPYIGRIRALSRGLWMATGFGGWGMTSGTLAAMILRDEMQGRRNPWSAVYDATRINLTGGGRRFVSENLDMAGRWLGDKVSTAEVGDPSGLRPDEAAVLKVGGETVAAYRNGQGALHVVSANCTHLGCHVRWNAVARSWDCPCHGSRFAPDGEVLCGPAVNPLHRVAGYAEDNLRVTNDD